VQDLHSQISDFRTHSSQQRETLRRELEAHRERKRQEELTRGDLKSRTKSLEDSKRNAENAKRDAERKLKSAETRRDDVARKITHLRNEIAKSRSKLGQDREWVENVRSGGIGDGDHGKGGRVHLDEELWKRKAEIKVAEDVITVLAVRAKELEDKAMEGRERLKVVLEKSRRARFSQPSEQDHNPTTPTTLPPGSRDQEVNLSWPPAQPSPSSSIPTSDQPTDSEPRNTQNGYPSPKQVSLSAGLPTSRLLASNDPIRPNLPAKFAPFDDPASLVAADGETLRSAFLIPSGLINSLPDATPDIDLSRSFKGDSDPFITQPNCPVTTWRRNNGTDAHETTNTIIQGFADDSPFEPVVGSEYRNGRIVGHFDSGLHPQLREESLDQQRATLRTTVPHQNSVLDPFSSTPNLVDPSRDLEVTSAPRRWFSVKERKKLNPEAEAFNLPNTKSFFKPTVPTFFDALNPSKSELVSPTGPGSPPRRFSENVAHSSFFSRAFAPSPAERAALGAGKFHSSLEKLPSLSDMPGSLHTSPVLPHTSPPIHEDPVTVVPGSSFAKSMAWLNSLPRRKPKFSPWDDEEH